jgi:prepilin-type N-terminal cleavage/methylation domain-containing protein
VKSRGFTLLELIIVIIIVGILATLGFVQYSAVIEKSRGAEARNVIGTLRAEVAAKVYENIGSATLTNANLGIVANMIPPSCATTNFFSYSVDGSCTTTTCTFTATRCTSGGKTPNASTAGTLLLVFTSGGTDTWSSSAGY